MDLWSDEGCLNGDGVEGFVALCVLDFLLSIGDVVSILLRPFSLHIPLPPLPI